MTYLLFELVIGRQERRESEKRKLVERLRSTQIREVVDALDGLRRAGWLADGSLHGENLRGVFWKGTDLHGANLSGTHLEEARLEDTKLQGAILESANLQKAVLVRSKLQGANLERANLQEANLRRAEFDEATILPDGTEWKPDVDVTRFTQTCDGGTPTDGQDSEKHS